MNKYIFSTLFLTSLFYSSVQDIDLYKKERNDNYKLPDINELMNFDEFELLSQNIRMKDMLYADFVPGYIHFKVQERKKGYWLLGIRSASYLVMGAVLLDANATYGKINFSTAKLSDKKIYQNVFYGALIVASASYLYDIIHGDTILHKKQEKIRYKYTIKTGEHPVSYTLNNKLYPSIACTIQF